MAPRSISESGYICYAATEAAVPGKDGASAALQAQFDSLNVGTLVFVASSNAVYDKPKGDKYAAGGRIQLLSSSSSGATGVDGTYTNAAGLVAVGDCVTQISAGAVGLADATTFLTPAFGFVVDVIDAVTCTVRLLGEVTLPGLTAGATYYLSETAGDITDTIPTGSGINPQKVGVAKSTTTLNAFITPTFDGTILTAIGDATSPVVASINDPGSGICFFPPGSVTIAASEQEIVSVSLAGVSVTVTDTTTNDYTAVETITHALTAPSVGAANIGVRTLYKLANSDGSPNDAGAVGVNFGSADPLSCTGRVELIPAFAGSLGTAGLRVSGSAASQANGLEIFPVTELAALTTGVRIVPYGASDDISANHSGKGTGGVNLRNALNTITVFGSQNVSAAIFGFAAEAGATVTATGTQAVDGVSGRFTMVTTDGTSKQINNNRVLSATSKVFLCPRRIDATAIGFAATCAAGSFTVTCTAAPTVDTPIDFFIVNTAT